MRKSDIQVIKTSNTPSSNCQLIIRGIEPQEEVDLCTNYCANLTLVDSIDSPSTTNVNAGPLPSVPTSSEYKLHMYMYIRMYIASIKSKLKVVHSIVCL